MASTFRPGVEGRRPVQFSVKFQVVRIRPVQGLCSTPQPGAVHTPMSTTTLQSNCIYRSRYRVGFCTQAAVQWSLGVQREKNACSGQRYLGEAETTAGAGQWRGPRQTPRESEKDPDFSLVLPQHPAPPSQPVEATWQRDREKCPAALGLCDNAGTSLDEHEAAHSKRWIH